MYKKCKDDYPDNAADATPARGGAPGSPPTRASHRAAIQADIAKVEAAHGVKSHRASAARGKLTEYDRACCRADMGRRMIDREQRRTGHAA